MNLKAQPETRPDFLIADHGTIIILTPATDGGVEWSLDHLPEDATRWGSGYVVEHRYISDIVDGIVADGLTIGLFGALA